MTGTHPRARDRFAPRAVGALLVVLAAMAGPVAPRIAAAPLETVRIGYSSFDGGTNPLYVAEEQGFFAKYGLAPDIVFLESAARATQALAAGAVDATTVSGVSGMEAIAHRADVVFIGETLETIIGSMVTRSSITDPRTQLRGTRWAISSFGSDSELGATRALEYYGLTPGRDVVLVPIGNQTLRYAALRSGAAAATTLLPPVLNEAAADTQFRVWIPMSQLVPQYLDDGWLVGRRTLAARRDVLQRMLAAYAEGTAFYRTHKAASLPVIERLFKVDAATAAETYDYYAPLMAVNPRISPVVFQHTLATLPAEDRTLTMAQVVDMSLVDSLDRQGLFQRLTVK